MKDQRTPESSSESVRAPPVPHRDIQAEAAIAAGCNTEIIDSLLIMNDDRVANALNFISQLQKLLENERRAEVEQNSLLLSSYSSKILEQRGLALCNLGVANISVGLGGRKYFFKLRIISDLMSRILSV